MPFCRTLCDALVIKEFKLRNAAGKDRAAGIPGNLKRTKSLESRRLLRHAPSLTLGGLYHLSIHGRGDDGLGEVLQVAMKAVAEGRQLQLVQLFCWLIC